jgi:hypothetical protein
MLFLLAMEPLHRLFNKAQEWRLLKELSPACDTFRVSLFADDVAVFIRPSEQDWLVTNAILNLFAEASDLYTNIVKTKCFPISCQEISLDFLTNASCVVSELPCSYLGLPLHYKKPTRAMVEPLVQKIGKRLPGWKRNLISRPGRELLVKSFLFAMPTFFMSVFKLPRWAIT